jgi:lysophospholipase L1-like esterase
MRTGEIDFAGAARRWTAVLATMAGCLFAGVPVAAADYVALGDSYAAGPLIPLQIEPYGCLKSDHNYAHLAAPKLDVPELRDPSCSGAETEDMTQEQGVSPGPNPPQFDALDTDTQVVTLQIGGNDIGFSGIADDCLSATSPSGTHCKDQYVVDGRDEVSERIAATAPKVAAVIQGIHERSPQARVLVVNYPALFPETGNGCWPQMPVAEGDVPWLREKEQELNRMLADQAAAGGAQVIDWYLASIGHDACQPPLIRWVEPAVPASPAAPVHPNLFGMLGAADLVVAGATAGAPAPGTRR